MEKFYIKDYINMFLTKYMKIFRINVLNESYSILDVNIEFFMTCRSLFE